MPFCLVAQLCFFRWIVRHHTGVFSPSSATYCSKSFWNLLSTTFCLHFFSQNGPGVYYRIYYRRIGVDEERDFQQQTLKQLGTISRGFYVVKIQKKYYWTQYEVKVQVFNDLCLDHNCTVAPVSNTTSCAKNVTSLGKFYLQISKFLKRFYCLCLWNAQGVYSSHFT